VTPSRLGALVGNLLDEVRVTFDDGRLAITGPKLGGFRRKTGLDLTIKAPVGSSCRAQTASADVACIGRLGGLTVHTASGDVTMASASGAVAVQTASGDVFVDHAAAGANVSTASGDVQVAHASGEVRVNTASGDVAVHEMTGPVAVHTASGDINVKDLSSGNADVSSLSGDVQITVRPGIGVYLDLSSTAGDVRSDLDAADADEIATADGPAIEIKCRSLSGDIRISKGQPAAA